MVAPGEIVSLYGSGLGPPEGVSLVFDPVLGKLPVSGAGLTVTFNGFAAPVYFISAGQVNVQAPYELQGAVEAEVRVTVNGVASTPAFLRIAPAQPGLFPAIFHSDGSLNSPANPAVSGSVVILFATGQGVTSPPSPTGAFPTSGVYPVPVAPVSLSIGGRPAELLFTGQAPGTAGVMQINAKVPEGLGASTPAQVLLTIGGRDSQLGVTIAIR